MNTLYMMIGLPASGKSTYAKEISQETGAQIVSSDEIRKELWGSYDDREHNSETFSVVENEVLEGLEKGNVIYDATNLNYKRRMNFLQRLKNIKTIAIFMLTPYEECLRRNSIRQRKVPEDAMQKMYFSIDVPQYYEGFKYIEIHKEENCVESFDKFFKKLWKVPQHNPHHTLTIGEHCFKTKELVVKKIEWQPGWSLKDDYTLMRAAEMHDIGKLATQTFINYKGERSDVAHYYGHEHVGAYIASLYVQEPGILVPNSEEEMIIRLIRWHMLLHRPLSKRSIDKYTRLLGAKTWDQLLALEWADSHAR